jgi:hypothetical protein
MIYSSSGSRQAMHETVSRDTDAEEMGLRHPSKPLARSFR